MTYRIQNTKDHDPNIEADRNANDPWALPPHRAAWTWCSGCGIYVVIGFWFLVFSNGCATSTSSTSPSASASAGAVERLDLFLTSIALDLDGQPGPDGFGANIYASSRRSAQGTRVSAGRLEIVIYDGVVRPEEMPKATPLRAWNYTAAELKPHAQKTSIGTGYRFALNWGDSRPRAERITVAARYVAPGGHVVAAAPGTIPMTVK